MADISSSHYMKLLQSSQLKQSSPILTIKHQPPQALSRIKRDDIIPERLQLSQTAKVPQNTTSFLVSENVKLKKLLEQLNQQLKKTATHEISTQNDNLYTLQSQLAEKTQELSVLYQKLDDHKQRRQCLKLFLGGFQQDYETQRQAKKQELSNLLNTLNEQLSSQMQSTALVSSQFEDFHQQNELLMSQSQSISDDNSRLQQIHIENQQRIQQIEQSIGENAAQLEELENIENLIQLATSSQKYRIIDIQRQLRMEYQKKKKVQDAANQLGQYIGQKQDELQTLQQSIQLLGQSVLYYQGLLNQKVAETEQLIYKRCELMQRIDRSQEILCFYRDLLQEFSGKLLGRNISITSMSDVAQVLHELEVKYENHQCFDMEPLYQTESSDSQSYCFAEQPVRSESCPAQVSQSHEVSRLQKILSEFATNESRQMNLAVDTTTLNQIQNLIKRGRFKKALSNFDAVRLQIINQKPAIPRRKFSCECDSMDSVLEDYEDLDE